MELTFKTVGMSYWDFDVTTRQFKAFNDPVNDYVAGRPVSINEYLEVIHPEDRSLVNDALQTMLSGERSNINFTCRMQTKYDEIWQYCNITGVPFEEEECGKISRFTGLLIMKAMEREGRYVPALISRHSSTHLRS